MQPSKTTQQGPLDREVRFALVSDLDWTMVDHNDHTHDKLLRLNHVWNTDLSHDSLLVYSTGRSPHLYEELAAEVPLLVPDILVCSVGTEILFQGVPHKPWSDFLDRGWDREKTLEIAQAEPALTLQDASEQRPHKISFKVSSGSDAVVQELTAKLKQAGLEVNVIYSAGVDLDLLPAAASKGKALAFLLEEMDGGAGRPRDGVLVAGDSGNDIELFAVAGVHGCMVANAHPELRAWCDAHASSTLFQVPVPGEGALRAGRGPRLSFEGAQGPHTVCAARGVVPSGSVGHLGQGPRQLTSMASNACTASPARRTPPAPLRPWHTVLPGLGGRPRRHLPGPGAL
ncbi:SPH3 [Auxenochlorella protothecoides x Auxenochlorella symbiontica]